MPQAEFPIRFDRLAVSVGVTFNDKTTKPITVAKLLDQAISWDIGRFETIVVLVAALGSAALGSDLVFRFQWSTRTRSVARIHLCSASR
jgi:hypothetical protein